MRREREIVTKLERERERMREVGEKRREST